MRNIYKNISSILMLATLLAACAHAPQGGPSSSSTSEAASVLADKPYSIRIDAIAALDPKPLKISSFSPDPNPRSQGVRIVSAGRMFPFSYEVISIRDTTNPNALETVSKALDRQSDIILKEQKSTSKLGNHLHYFHRVSVNGKPSHVSSNYIFIRNNTFYHLSATNYAARVMARDSWGDIKPDPNAELEVMRLIDALEFK